MFALDVPDIFEIERRANLNLWRTFIETARQTAVAVRLHSTKACCGTWHGALKRLTISLLRILVFDADQAYSIRV
jgi:hypothetical protein